MKDILRKCSYCDDKGVKTIKIGESKFLYYNGKYYHYECFIEYKNKHNEYNLTQEQLIKMADELVLKTKTIKSVRESIDRDRLTYWLYDNYNISVLPNLFFQKLKKINDGTYSDKIIVPISCYELLQIFKKLKSYLDKINSNNERKGKGIPLSQRVNYDLAIVLNNYDEYVKWKQKQKTEDIEKIKLQEEIKSKNCIQINNITTVQKNNIQQKNDNNEEINIADILDEVF
jgi:hypothetical protein